MFIRTTAATNSSNLLFPFSKNYGKKTLLYFVVLFLIASLFTLDIVSGHEVHVDEVRKNSAGHKKSDKKIDSNFSIGKLSTESMFAVIPWVTNSLAQIPYVSTSLIVLNENICKALVALDSKRNAACLSTPFSMPEIASSVYLMINDKANEIGSERAALVAVFAVSIVPIFILFPIAMFGWLFKGSSGKERSSLEGERSSPSGFLHLLTVFAAGGLLGDVFLHLLPSCSKPTDVQYALLGIFCFWFLERVCFSGKSSCCSNSVLVLNLLADSFHNFTDGLALASSFSISNSLGISTTLAVFMHEIPHELGDYALLVGPGGASPIKAIILQFVTAFAAFLGCVLGIVLTSKNNFLSSLPNWIVKPLHLTEGTSWMIPFTAGGFLHLVLAGIFPSLSRQRGFFMKSTEVIFFLSGVVLMTLID